jgi:PTH2 family peptidyl-tRNA hydrolase
MFVFVVSQLNIMLSIECRKNLLISCALSVSMPKLVIRQCAMSEFRYKQAIVIRTDLKMGKGKIAAQASHAAVSAAEEARKHRAEWWEAWLNEGQRKVVVKVKDEVELLQLKLHAERMRLPHALIYDRGLTQLPPDTLTCLGIGPAPSDRIDKITGKLRLL